MAVKKKVVIEIEKDRLIKIVLCVVGIILLCLICFFASVSNSKEYVKNNISSSNSEDNSVLQQATKEAASISDEERKNPTDISVLEYLELYSSDEYSLVLFSKEDCSYCKLAVPIIENIIYKDHVDIKRIDVGSLTDEDVKKLAESNSYFTEGFGTPVIIIIGKNEIKDKVEGLVVKEQYESFFKEYGFMG